MTDEQLRDIEERANAASGGPWANRPNDFDDWGLVRGADGMPVASCAPEARIGDFREQAREGTIDEWHIGPPEVAVNTEFIARARADIPALIAEVRRLQGEAARAREGCACCQCPCAGCASCGEKG